jgi:hypothetical protein
VETLSHCDRCVAVSLSSPEVSRLRLIGGILKTAGRLGCYLYSLTVRRVHAVLVTFGNMVGWLVMVANLRSAGEENQDPMIKQES